LGRGAAPAASSPATLPAAAFALGLAPAAAAGPCPHPTSTRPCKKCERARADSHREGRVHRSPCSGWRPHHVADSSDGCLDKVHRVEQGADRGAPALPRCITCTPVAIAARKRMTQITRQVFNPIDYPVAFWSLSCTINRRILYISRFLTPMTASPAHRCCTHQSRL
jgi:hypothetical protein